MGGRGGGSPGSTIVMSSSVPAGTPPGETPAERALVNAYWDYVNMNNVDNGWVRLTNMRISLAAQGFGRAEQDAAITRLALREDARLIPIEDLKSMTQADQASRAFIGGQFKDAIIMRDRGRNRWSV